jgi:dCMP deaminase
MCASCQQDKEQQFKWDIRFIDQARLISSYSKDRTKVGCVIVGPSREHRTDGYNGIPRHVRDLPERFVRPGAYQWIEHAERNAIYNAARVGIPLEGCTIYVPWFPCMDCARAIVQSGIATLVAYHPDLNHEKWGQDFKNVLIMLEEAKVKIRWMDKEFVPAPPPVPAITSVSEGRVQ